MAKSEAVGRVCLQNPVANKTLVKDNINLLLLLSGAQPPATRTVKERIQKLCVLQQDPIISERSMLLTFADTCAVSAANQRRGMKCGLL
jgi:hypothetical protein